MIERKPQYCMQKNSLFVISVILISLYGCIERYYPDEEDLQTGTLVVVAQLNSLTGVQSVYLSRSTSLTGVKYDPVSGCYVQIIRADGMVRDFEESKPGEYVSFLDEQFLRSGEQYSLVFITPKGERYESEFETLHPACELNSLYFNREDHLTSDPGNMEEGIQFYIDFEIEKDSGRYLRWQLIETFEIHNPEYPVLIFDVDRRMKDLPDTSSWRTCWITLDIPEIYTLDVGNMEGTKYKQRPLNFVSNETRRLYFRYSLLVRQLSFSEKAFWYWNELGKNLQSKGNLFDTQPSLTQSNICNTNDEDELIIGYFSISGASERRIFVENVPDLRFSKDPYYCAPGAYPQFLYYFSLQYLPVYLASGIVDGERKTGQVNKYCVDCREYKGSSHIKPDFW